MKIILVGASGDVGRAALAELSRRHDIIEVGRAHGEIRTDISDRGSIEQMYLKAGPVDAVVSAAGAVHFAPLEDFGEDDYLFGLKNKAMGQINLVLAGLKHLPPGGSFTLTSGILDRDPVASGSGAATANGALAGFVKAAAIELPRDFRINVVSPGLLEASEGNYGHLFPGHERVSSERVGRAFAKSVEGRITGQVICVDR